VDERTQPIPKGGKGNTSQKWGPRMGENWETGLGYKLALGVAAATVLISLLDMLHAPSS